MKQPKLPGTEKFKFSSKDKTVIHISSPKQMRPVSVSQPSDEGSPVSQTFSSKRSSICSQDDSTPSSPIPSSLLVLRRNDSKKKAVLPISGKMTSRMLTNTNLELNVDHAEIVSENAVKTSLSQLNSNRIPSCPNLGTSSRALNTSKSSLDTYFRKMSLQNSTIQELPPDFDWRKIRSSISRLSTSCSSSCSSEENIWVLRKNS